MKKALSRIAAWLGGLLFIGGPVAIAVIGTVDGVADQRFFAVDWEFLPVYALFMLLFLLPAILLSIWLLLEHRRGGLRGTTRVLLTILFILSLVASFFGLLCMGFTSPWYSRTDDPAHYMQLDTYVNASPAYVQSFFPQEPGEDAVYRYRADYGLLSLEIYAGWTLSLGEIDAEAARIEALWQEKGWTVTREERGRFTCLSVDQEPRIPGRYVSLFAYDPKTGECRWYDRDAAAIATLLPEIW